MIENNHSQRLTEEQDSCSVGGCSTVPGICPGTALLIGLLIGMGLSSLTGLGWLELPTALIIAGLLMVGVYPTGRNWPAFSQQESADNIG